MSLFSVTRVALGNISHTWNPALQCLLWLVSSVYQRLSRLPWAVHCPFTAVWRDHTTFYGPHTTWEHDLRHFSCWAVEWGVSAYLCVSSMRVCVSIALRCVIRSGLLGSFGLLNFLRNWQPVLHMVVHFTAPWYCARSLIQLPSSFLQSGRWGVMHGVALTCIFLWTQVLWTALSV